MSRLLRWPWLGVAVACALTLSGVLRAASSKTPREVARTPKPASRLFHPPLAGTSLDPELQKDAGRLLAAANPVAGAAVMVHAPSGRIIAWQEYRRDRRHGPSLVTQAIAPAASVFKIVTSAALLSRTRQKPEERVCVLGGEHGISREHLEPSRDPRARCRRFDEALGHSVNAVFAQLATQRLMRKDLIDVADELGFNRPLPFEKKADMGLLDVPYNDLAFARTAIGAQRSKLSVLGAAHLLYTVANGGLEPRMTLSSSAPAARPAPRRTLDAATAQRLRAMLEVTVRSGTSYKAFSDERGRAYLGGIRVAGKTGTLQPDREGPLSSWFAGFAPSRSPEVVVSVLLQNGPVWRTKANVVARDLLRAYFKGRRGVSPPLVASY